MVSYGFLFTLTNNSNVTTQFQLVDNNIASHYSKERNFGNQAINELTVFRTDLSITGFDHFDTSHTIVKALYDFFSAALDDQPCHVSIDFYTLPEPADTEAPEYEGNITEILFVPENFIKRIVEDAEVGTVVYDITPMNYSISESTTIQLDPSYTAQNFNAPEFEDGDY